MLFTFCVWTRDIQSNDWNTTKWNAFICFAWKIVWFFSFLRIAPKELCPTIEKVFKKKIHRFTWALKKSQRRWNHKYTQQEVNSWNLKQKTSNVKMSQAVFRSNCLAPFCLVWFIFSFSTWNMSHCLFCFDTLLGVLLRYFCLIGFLPGKKTLFSIRLMFVKSAFFVVAFHPHDWWN